MRYTNAIKSLDKNKKTKDPYAKFQDLLQYWLGEGVSPELFPEFPGHAMPLKNEITNEHEWYICTYCRKEISLAHVFSEEHCFKMGRSWEAFWWSWDSKSFWTGNRTFVPQGPSRLKGGPLN